MFTAGYLRSYARLLGLPPDELVAQYVDSETRDLPRMDANSRELPERYRKVAAALPSSFSLSTAQRRQSSRTRQQAVVGAGLAVVVIAIGWAVSYWWNHNNAPQLAQQSGSAQMVERQDGSASPQPAASGTADMAASINKTKIKGSTRLAIMSSPYPPTHNYAQDQCQ